MNTNYTNSDASLSRLEDFMRENLKESRYGHSLRVEEMAVRLAEIYGLDTGKAAFAGRYHDIAKNFDEDRMDACIRKYGLPDELLGNNALAHSKVGAAILEHEFGVTDEEILNGVRYHTTGRAGMSAFEVTILTADVVEDGRTYSVL
ncbi:MAG: bis(5'-nucleosyl)-tetraphosphatase (symmetrical) YqeK [Mogibacterium sp.]|nr:bis(5'-nucleosyl)-tetraphosphatase (symmetrical) YqeK [Mogibacterium sp.]